MGSGTDRLNALRTGDPWDFRWEKNPRCPHCARSCLIRDEEWYHLYEEGEHQVECPSCDHEFTVSVSVEYRFSTDEQDETEDEPLPNQPREEE